MGKDKTSNKVKINSSETKLNDVIELRDEKEVTNKESKIHVLGEGIICDTEARGHATPQGRSPIKIVLEASEGFIPLWAKDTIIRWRFRERSLSSIKNPEEAKEEFRDLFGEALLAWGDAAPVKFTEDNDVWDFEVVMRSADECTPLGCALASAFFPDSGRHEFVLYPKLFTQSRKEQIETIIHEVGHVFGLRHFFANVSETRWKSEIFGTHNKFSIMNYGKLSELTEDDKKDLKQLYQLAWSGALTEINGTPIRFMKPFHIFAFSSKEVVAIV
ncbi:reprolysin-like metallo-peptidase family M12B [Pontibacter ummariensis]|uniref:Metallo-peptidase family M12B Reprolysin-like n=1 Tax=Pontibacter ummariensis TaxID=1610492 RepID=A0A239FWG3_9BACT|nr:matrixin family metalloprotease [Pontibacter ummariensis]PRY11886.1 reprolysin-like metallo-peptidase family M12B [Pontibacter ummariensis]SNS61367.1 Metallo-peptidase family M12B Reprolysin-like [Pontibacter ummariensis]